MWVGTILFSVEIPDRPVSGVGCCIGVEEQDQHFV
jgi:hypothetical protein